MSDAQRDDIRSAMQRAIESWQPVDGPRDWSDERFDELAVRIFERQFRNNDPYRRFCRHRGVDPSDVSQYRDIPAVATEVFKHVDLTCARDPSRVFRTSGTTRDRRGRHPFETLELYRASLRRGFVRFVNPERRDYRVLVCAPSPDDVPDSSLSFMFGDIVDRWGDDGSDFFATDEGSGLEFTFESMAEALDRARRDSRPTLVLGTAYGLAALFDATDRTWDLPAGSRVFETGGFKGTASRWTKDDLYAAFRARLGVNRGDCVGEYSMTELSSQAYTTELSTSSSDEDVDAGFVAPPWARLEVVDPAAPERRCDAGEVGLIRWYDLANVDSVCVVQTSDLGRTVGPGVEYLGRAEGSEIRGCSLTAEEMVENAESS